MSSINYDADLQEIQDSLKNCIKIPMQYMDVTGTTLSITLPAKITTTVEELVAIATLAGCFDLTKVIINRHDVILYMTVQDVEDMASGRITPEEFLERLEVDANYTDESR